MSKYAFYEYVKDGNEELFTIVCLPNKNESFPVIICRSPYVEWAEELTENELCQRALEEYDPWLENGYAVVFQHCRGCGKSTGDFIPYLNERQDGLRLQAWIREQSFYCGEMYLFGGSYTASVHYTTSPFASDIKGAVFEVQDCERYNCNYRNGFYKIGLHGDWYANMYKKSSKLPKTYTKEDFRMLPLLDFSIKALSERAEDFDKVLMSPKRSDELWKTHLGGVEAHDAIKNAKIPILLTTGFYDIYTGGVFDMWKGLDKETREMSALAVHPYDHGGISDYQPLAFENGELKKKFGRYDIAWINATRGKGKHPFEVGKVTYYRLFDNKWCTDDFNDGAQKRQIVLGDKEITYKYNPHKPATFNGGLSANFGGTAWQDAPSQRDDIVSIYTSEFESDTLVKGKMTAELCVKSDAKDTCFYVRLSLCKENGDFGLRDDINQISNFDINYKPNSEIKMSFSFDEHAFVIRKGERLRIDISSSAYPHYVPHTNQRGLFSTQERAVVATNTVILSKSYIEIPTGEYYGTI